MKRLAIVSIMLLMATSAFGATKHWEATVDCNFTNWNNWSDTAVFTGYNDGCISLSDTNAPIMYAASPSLSTTRSLFVGGIDYGEFQMQGGTITLGRIEIGGDWMMDTGADGAMTMSGGTFTTTASAEIGNGNTGSLTVSGGNFNVGTFLKIGSIGDEGGNPGYGKLVMTAGTMTADYAYLAKDANTVGSIDMSGSSSLALDDYIIMGNSDSIATVTVRDSATITGTYIEIDLVHFVIDSNVTSSRMTFSSTDDEDYDLQGEIDLSFYNTAKPGLYNLITFGADLSSVDISELLSENSAARGWSLKIVSEDGSNGSILQALYAPGHTSILATEHILYTTPDPNIYITTPGITVCPNGRLVATFQVSLDSEFYSLIPEINDGNDKCFVYTSDDHGQSWQYRANTGISLHARPFVAGNKLYILGHDSNLRITASDDWGNSWETYTRITTGQKWHGSATSMWYKGDYVYLAMERKLYDISDIWNVVGLAPVLMRADVDDDLTVSGNWTYASSNAFIDYIDDANLDTLLGLPFYPCYYPDRYYFPNASPRSCSPMGWLETNIIRIVDPNNCLYDPSTRTFHLVMRANTTGLTNMACLMKAVVNTNGTITTSFETTPSGEELLYIPLPGGQMRFHLIYDNVTKLYWLLSTQATDSMRKADTLPDDRFGSPDNERRRMQLHFSKNLFDWCFAGMVAIGPSEGQARHYAAMEIDGNDLIILSRSGNEDAKSAHNCNMITFHKIHDFRSLVY